MMVLATIDSSLNWLTRAARPKAIPIEIAARISGTSAATRAPKRTIRMRRATLAPMLSPRAMSASARVLTSSVRLASPTVSTSKPAAASRWARIRPRKAAPCSAASSSDPTSVTGTIVVLRSAETRLPAAPGSRALSS